MTQSIGIVGCGAIGQALMRAADSGKLNVAVAGVTSRNDHRAHEPSSLPGPPRTDRKVGPIGRDGGRSYRRRTS